MNYFGKKIEKYIYINDLKKFQFGKLSDWRR